MKIVITDGYTLNPGDLSWDEFHKLGDVVLYDRTDAHDIVSRCSGAEIVLTNKTPFSAATLSELPDLKFIGVTATGHNIIDGKFARQKNIPVSNVPGYGTASVAQHTIALILELSNQAGLHSRSVRNGEWAASADWCYTLSPVNELFGKTLGIVGMGNIGWQVARIGQAMGMHIIYHTRRPSPEYPGDAVSLEQLFEASDVVSLHCPQTPENTGFVNSALISKMKRTAFLINTSRGGLINEQDLADALKNNVIAGAGLDVLSKEPPSPDHPLTGLKNCIITPHIAWISFESRQRIMVQTIANVKSFLAGKPVNVVN